jgi:hypothetical protein
MRKSSVQPDPMRTGSSRVAHGRRKMQAAAMMAVGYKI